MNYDFIKEICEKYGAEYAENQPLAQYTSFKIGGSCPILVKPDSTPCLCELVKAFNSYNTDYKIMGKGSNLLISDKGVDFPVVALSAMGEIRFEGERAFCGSGAALISVCREAAENALGGLEFAYGIPGSLGGAVYMNAGAYGGEMKDIVECVTYIDETGKIRRADRSQLDFSYRHSFFCDKKYIITDIAIKLSKGDKQSINAKMQELMARRKEKQPLEYPSAGSTFKRPEGDFAGRLIEEAGLKGFSVGGAQVSEKHCGFVINKGSADFCDVKAVIERVREKVKEVSGRELECEVIIWE
ncbi:MAG: UDP-N-acetylmuramate dehydrogenase [Firmicutes bacterium]|nr:UDP-N-acetylmuramate dehydrogenase [[Eubacterium] siraeum]MCM1487113.1 UDP-N-acetylmuramate dehydrogenase [Bacillota bacterium]